MLRRSAPVLSPLFHAGALVLATGPGSAAAAENVLQFRLEAYVPLRCAIVAIETPADKPANLVIATTCNAERFQLVLNQGALTSSLLAARSSAGAVQISGSAVTITSMRPGYALTTIELAAPVNPGQIAVTLLPI